MIYIRSLLDRHASYFVTPMLNWGYMTIPTIPFSLPGFLVNVNPSSMTSSFSTKVSFGSLVQGKQAWGPRRDKDVIHIDADGEIVAVPRLLAATEVPYGFPTTTCGIRVPFGDHDQLAVELIKWGDNTEYVYDTPVPSTANSQWTYGSHVFSCGRMIRFDGDRCGDLAYLDYSMVASFYGREETRHPKLYYLYVTERRCRADGVWEIRTGSHPVTLVDGQPFVSGLPAKEFGSRLSSLNVSFGPWTVCPLSGDDQWHDNVSGVVSLVSDWAASSDHLTTVRSTFNSHPCEVDKQSMIQELIKQWKLIDVDTFCFLAEIGDLPALWTNLAEWGDRLRALPQMNTSTVCKYMSELDKCYKRIGKLSSHAVENAKELRSLRKRTLTLCSAVSKSAGDFAETSGAKQAANDWLISIFGYAPTSSDVAGLWEGFMNIARRLETPERSYRTRKASTQAVVGTSSIRTSSTLSIEVDTSVRDFSDNPDLVSYACRVGLFPTPATLWELAPYSFMVDYISNVGDLYQGTSQWFLLERHIPVLYATEGEKRVWRPSASAVGCPFAGRVTFNVQYSYYERRISQNIPYAPVGGLEIREGSDRFWTNGSALVLQALG